MADIIDLGFGRNRSPEELEQIVRDDGCEEVLVLAYDSEGEFVLRSSGMSNKDALWLLEEAKRKIMDTTSLGLEDED